MGLKVYGMKRLWADYKYCLRIAWKFWRKRWNTLIRIFTVLADILNGHFTDTSLRPCRFVWLALLPSLTAGLCITDTCAKVQLAKIFLRIHLFILSWKRKHTQRKERITQYWIVCDWIQQFPANSIVLSTCIYLCKIAMRIKQCAWI
jgi:hypothetical protein